MLTPEYQQYLRGLLKPIYPTEDSLEEAIQKIDEALPEVSRHRLTPLINNYHNTLISTILKDTHNE